jgi:hypothetical protein
MTKYVVVNGLMKEVSDSATPEVETKGETLADKVLTTPYSFHDATAAALAAGTSLAPKTKETIDLVQSPQYTRQFGDHAGNLVDLMGQVFTEQHIPIALASKLVYLKGFRVDIKIDDSGSMSTITENGKTRWQNTLDRLISMMMLLQLVPTGNVRISFLNRWETKNINRRRRGGMSPQQFYREAVQFLEREFAKAPAGATPIFSNLQSMVSRARKKPTAIYLITDGNPDSYDFEDRESHITAIRNLILNRRNPQYMPITLMCCSNVFTDTLWMHEIEEIACRPGSIGFVAAIQNFIAERLEVLNDQGAWFPYTHAIWLVCNLVAALNPYDLDALDQHEPLTKVTLDNTFLGYVSSQETYEGYFVQHPNAVWTFKEDYEAFKTTEYAAMIPSVSVFQTILADKLNADMNARLNNTEFQSLAFTEQQVMTNMGRSRPDNLWRARQNFLYYHCLQMEQTQLSTANRSNTIVAQHLWGDYIYNSGRQIISSWEKFLKDFDRDYIQVHNQQAQGDAPPPYSAHIPGAAPFIQPAYFHSVGSLSASSSAFFSPMAPDRFRQIQARQVTLQTPHLLGDEPIPADFERSAFSCIPCC